MRIATQPTAHSNGATSELNQWRDHTRVFLQPIAAPSILGLFGFAVATFMVTAYLVGWYGSASSPSLIFPFATAAGGIAQGVAAIWAYRARDGLATAVHGIWAALRPRSWITRPARIPAAVCRWSDRAVVFVDTMFYAVIAPLLPALAREAVPTRLRTTPRSYSRSVGSQRPPLRLES